MFYSYLILTVCLCLLSIPYISITLGQSAYTSKNFSTTPRVYLENNTVENKQTNVPSNDSTTKDNTTKDNMTLLIASVTGKIEEAANAIKNSSASTLNASVFSTQLMQKVNKSLDSKLEQIKKSIDDSSGYATIGLIAGLISIALSLGIPYFYDKLKRPDLVIETGTVTERISPYVYFHGKVVNKPHKYWHWIERNPAFQTRVKMEFLDKKGQKLAIINQPLDAKWVNAPDPLVWDPEIKDRIYDVTKLALLYNQTIVSDCIGQEFVIFVRIQNKENYAMTGETFAGYHENGLQSDAYRINETEFLVKIQATSGNNSSKSRTFCIRTGLSEYRRDFQIN